jgi:hypothetical protein
MSLHRYWIKLDLPKGQRSYGMRLGCGVTARSLEDALDLVKQQVFKDAPLPKILAVTEDVDISTLDRGHVQANIGYPEQRGIWFPVGYELPGVPRPTVSWLRRQKMAPNQKT